MLNDLRCSYQSIDPIKLIVSYFLDVCADHHEWCGANPGWYGPELCYNYQYEESVRKYCLKMCGICRKLLILRRNCMVPRLSVNA